MPRHFDAEISIPLARRRPHEVGQREDYFNIIQTTYTTQYLEALGVEPNERYRKLVARCAPIDKCEIEAQWDDTSAICSNLRILQAPIGKGPHGGGSSSSKAPPPPSSPGKEASVKESAQAVAAEAAAQQAAASADSRAAGYEGYANASPPSVPDAAAVAKRLEAARAALHGTGAQSDNDGVQAADARVEMQLHDLRASEGVDPHLVEELERARRRARGDDSRTDLGPTLIRWGEEGMRELESLKRKFILPFAAQRPVRGTQGTSIVPWQSPDYRARVRIQVPEDHVEELSEPVRVTLEQIMEDAEEYAENHMPLELLTCRRDPWLFSAIRDNLSSPEATRMIGLLSHLLYWTVFGHLRPPDRRLPQPSMQSLILTMQELWGRLCDPGRQKASQRRGSEPQTQSPQQLQLLSRDSPTGCCFVLPVYVLSLKRNVESVFHRQYAKAFNDVHTGAALAEELVDQLNVLVMNVFDPDCSYASFGALDSSTEAIRLWRKLGVLQMKLGMTPATKMLSREFRTTPMMLLLMNGDGGEPVDPKTRQLLQKSASDAVLQTVSASPPRPGSSSSRMSGGPRSPAAPAAPPHLDERRRRALYRTACRRMSAAGLEVVSSRHSSRTHSH